MKKPALKVILSTLMIIILLFMAVTGALLYFGKTGMVWGVSRGVLRGVHFYAAISMCVLAVVHFILNFRLYLAGLRAWRKRGDAGRRR